MNKLKLKWSCCCCCYLVGVGGQGMPNENRMNVTHSSECDPRRINSLHLHLLHFFFVFLARVCVSFVFDGGNFNYKNCYFPENVIA